MIRKANINNLNKIVDLWYQMSSLHESIDDSFKLKNDAQEQFKKYACQVIQDTEKLSIVYDSIEVIGYLFAEIENRPPVYDVEQIGFITEISVNEKTEEMELVNYY